ncbi:PREDICTED: testis-expressed sequence 13B protein-like [Odobenus rosmarus divergens]|uniref:Testis-expressed sequence 13B protein-like n=1 Tax=Odobenus rosmarus divergens TaxID=9708 RepID=A0A9B0HI68_ODORO
MALNPEDPSAGFQHNNVVAFINEKMAGHTKGPEFYLENISLSWEEVENKLRDILEDSAVSSKAKDACAWSSLALGMRFACRQSQLHGRRVHWLQDYTKLHKSAAEALASHLKELTAQQEMERKESVFQLRQTQANMAEMRKESDLLRWRILRAELEFPRKRTQVPEEPGLATGSGARTEVAHEEEEEAGAAATSAAGATGRGRSQKDAEGAEATKKLGRGPVHLPGAEEQKNYTSDYFQVRNWHQKSSCKPWTVKENVGTGWGGVSESYGYSEDSCIPRVSRNELDGKLFHVLIKLYCEKRSKQAYS